MRIVELKFLGNYYLLGRQVGRKKTEEEFIYNFHRLFYFIETVFKFYCVTKMYSGGDSYTEKWDEKHGKKFCKTIYYYKNQWEDIKFHKSVGELTILVNNKSVI